jgi:sporulation related protein
LLVKLLVNLLIDLFQLFHLSRKLRCHPKKIIPHDLETTFETPKVHKVKNLKGWNIYICSALLLASLLFMPCDGFSQGKDYAVEVAALSSRECADELVNGLVSRGLEAYWLKTTQPKFGEFYRVRVGKFSNLDVARSFAEKLLDSGLLDTCSITDYEAPLYSLMMNGSKRGNTTLLPIEGRSAPIGAYCPINFSGKNSSKPEAAIAEIGKTGRSLSPDASGTSTGPPSSSVRDRELKNAMDAVIASTQAAMSSIRPKVNIAINLTAVNTGINKAVNNLISEREVVSRDNNNNNAGLDNNAGFDISANRQTATVPSPASLTSFLPRPERNSFAGSGRPAGRASFSDVGTSPGPRLRGVIEMNDGQMVLRLRNLDQERSFSGLARLTLTDDNDTSDITPVPIELNPEEEKVVPINDVKRASGDLMLMVYDQRQTVQLIRSVPFGKKPAVQRSVVAANREEEPQAANTFEGGAPPVDSNTWKLTDTGGGNSPSVEISGGTQQGLPNVTGTFDATKPPEPGEVPGVSGDSDSSPQNTPQNTNANIPPGQVVIDPRLISATSENTTMELGISGSQTIGYVKVSIRAGAFQDEKIAVFPTANGSVPFLIPAKDAKGQYSYEIRNDAGKVIGSGVQSFIPAGPDS